MDFTDKLPVMWCEDFRDGRTPILVATDVAARGLGEYQFWYIGGVE